MHAPRTSNLHRAKWRTHCRKKLADHIRKSKICIYSNICLYIYESDSQLGIAIFPSEVRLITSIDDPYQWRIFTTDKIALFQKQLSKHSTGAYIELCDGIGRHFKAVPADSVADYEIMDNEPKKSTIDNAGIPITQCDVIRHPTRHIEALGDSKTLRAAAEEWHKRADAELARRKIIEGKLSRAQSEIAGLSEEINSLRQVEAARTRDLEYMRSAISKISHVLQSRASKAAEDATYIIKLTEYIDCGK